MDSLLDEPIITLEEFFREFENRDFPVVGDGFINLYSKNFEQIEKSLLNGKRPIDSQLSELERLVDYFNNPNQFEGKLKTSTEIANEKYDTPEKIGQGYKNALVSFFEINPDKLENREELVKLRDLVAYFDAFKEVVGKINDIAQKYKEGGY